MPLAVGDPIVSADVWAPGAADAPKSLAASLIVGPTYCVLTMGLATPMRARSDPQPSADDSTVCPKVGKGLISPPLNLERIQLPPNATVPRTAPRVIPTVPKSVPRGSCAKLVAKSERAVLV